MSTAPKKPIAKVAEEVQEELIRYIEANTAEEDERREAERDARVAAARQAPSVRPFLVWSRFPYWTFEPVEGGTRVSVGDMRFAGQFGGRFSASTTVATKTD